ncbi:MAG: hypothetical protein QOI58_2873 [Thermoanaerobaculia bacterium]|jgi:hypothetical protein|nr:hypothetical protein [Thermoanaerobaculia bacterium]
MRSVSKSRLFLACILVAGITSVAQAQATRTWVSGVGDDVNPCSRTAPCKTFAGAISKTAAGGEIDVLDPGGFGGVTITKALTIDGNGTMASDLGSGTNGVTINVGSNNDVVTLRNISFNGATSGSSTGGLNAIRLVSSSGFAPKALHVENCQLFGFNRGISLENTLGLTRVFVDNTVIRNIVNEGIAVVPTGAGSINLQVSNSQIKQATTGISVTNNSTASVSNTVLAGNTTGASVANGTRLNLSDSMVTFSNTAGLTVALGGTMFLSANQIASNAVGVSNGGTTTGFTNNAIGGNGTDVTGNAIVSVLGK